MPIYTYACADCGDRFEVLVRKDEPEMCPACGSDRIERFLAATALGTETTSGLAMRAAKRRDARQASQNARTQQEYEEAHDDH